MRLVDFKNMRKLSIQKGFTLIELLVAIAIIGILAGFLMVNFIGVRQRARDGVRKSDLRQIQSALELYRSDQGNYPDALPACGSSLTGGVPTVTYMQKIPCDPLNAGEFIYTYVSAGGGATYSLFSCLENTNDLQKDDPNNTTYCTGGDTSRSFTLQNP